MEGISDVDLLVKLRRSSPGALDALRQRLGERLQADVDLVPLEAARRDPILLSEVLRDGRPLVDRGGMWPDLQAQRDRTQVQADHSGRELQQDAREALSYFQRLAAEQTAPSVAGTP